MMSNPGKTVSIYEVAEFVGQAHQMAMAPTNITAVFRKTGIYIYIMMISSPMLTSCVAP